MGDNKPSLETMKVINLGETNSALGNIIAQVRDRKVQKDSLRFRFNLERLGQIFAYELSKTLSYSEKEVLTPLATATVKTSDTKIVAATILRAGLPLHKGIIDIFDDAESAFIAAYRKYHRKGFDIEGGEPSFTHFISPVSSIYAIEYLQKRFPDNTCLWTAAVDEELTSQSYIIPGIGDAGDLAFGSKVNL